MRRIALAVLVLLLASSYASAELYRWTDEDGRLHITDRLQNVPERYRKEMDVRPSTPARPQPRRVERPAPAAPPEGAKPDLVLYDGKRLEWWEGAFEKKRGEIAAREAEIEGKKQFIAVFERGRRLGQLFEKAEVERYVRDKEGLAADEEGLDRLKQELEDLYEEARKAGVPRSARGK